MKIELKDFRDDFKTIRDVALWGFPAKYAGDKKALEAYSQGKYEAWGDGSVLMLGLFYKIILEVEKVNESNGRYNACQEIKGAISRLSGGN